MNAIDGKLLNLIQQGLPIADDPLQIIAEELAIDREDVLQRLKRLINEGFIRRIGGVFDLARMGYSSILMAMEVPEEIFYETVEIINSFEGVTHNYRRNHRLNIWFTLSTRSEDEQRRIISDIQSKTGIHKIYQFPVETNFKLKVFFDMGGGKDGTV